MTEFMKLIKQRESCRAYSSKPVEKDHILKMIEAARLAPSTANGQPWHFMVVTDKEKCNLIAKHTQQAFTKQASAFIILIEEKPTLGVKAVETLKKHDYTAFDLGIAATHLCLAATVQGLGTCMIGWFNESKVKETCGIPKKKRVRLLISVGYPENLTPRPKKRKTTEEILTWLDIDASI